MWLRETPPAGTHERNHNGMSKTNRRKFAGKFPEPDPHEKAETSGKFTKLDPHVKAETPANKDREWKTMRLTNDASGAM